jgi:hypothetical protein
MLHVLVESNTAVILLVKVLREEQQAGSVEIRSTAPPSSLYAAARTLLVVRNEPVAVVLGADSTDPEAAARRRLAAEEVIGEAAGSAPLRVLMAVPALEALLFRRPDAVARAYGHVPQGLLELGLLSPRDALEKLAPNFSGHQSSFNIIKELDDADVAALRAESPVRELREFLGELRRDDVVTAAAAGP